MIVLKSRRLLVIKYCLCVSYWCCDELLPVIGRLRPCHWRSWWVLSNDRDDFLSDKVSRSSFHFCVRYDIIFGRLVISFPVYRICTLGWLRSSPTCAWSRQICTSAAVDIHVPLVDTVGLFQTYCTSICVLSRSVQTRLMCFFLLGYVALRSFSTRNLPYFTYNMKLRRSSLFSLFFDVLRDTQNMFPHSQYVCPSYTLFCNQGQRTAFSKGGNSCSSMFPYSAYQSAMFCKLMV